MILVCLVSFNDPCQLDREYVSDVYSIVDSHSHAAVRGTRCEQFIRSDHASNFKATFTTLQWSSIILLHFFFLIHSLIDKPFMFFWTRTTIDRIGIISFRSLRILSITQQTFYDFLLRSSLGSFTHLVKFFLLLGLMSYQLYSRSHTQIK